MHEGCSVALMCLLLDTVPDWGLSLRVVFTTFAVCMVTALVLVQRGIAGATPAVPGGEQQAADHSGGAQVE